ncbi:methylated-DNA--[protein]-cysteine S-methyltransferase [Pseudidiomarina aestuarii]|nr:methylated-DNA--[protein]-cysteine S-methyltransferase [Pseudidiomarina aestuarii]
MKKMTSLYCGTVMTPLGLVYVGSDGVAVTEVYFTDEPVNSTAACEVVDRALQQLKEYFAGERQHFDLPLTAQGTAFQQSVWRQLRAIPYGQLASYKDIAQAVDNPKGVRAVGMANNRNPISIVIPCHRVVGSNGSLTGYGGGLDKKEWLIALEKAHSDAELH